MFQTIPLLFKTTIQNQTQNGGKMPRNHKLSEQSHPVSIPTPFLPSHTTTAGGCPLQSQDKHPGQSHLRGIKDSPPPLLF